MAQKFSLGVFIAAAQLFSPLLLPAEAQTWTQPAQVSYLGWTPPEPGAAAGVELFNISNNPPTQGSVFPQVAVSRSDPNLVVVAWRRYGLPNNLNSPDLEMQARCYASISRDGGKTFMVVDMMRYLRTPGEPPDPSKARPVWFSYQGVSRWYTDPGDRLPALISCNAPWTTIAKDNTIYFGGATYSGSTVTPYPRQGRAGLSVSEDLGEHWTPLTYGISIAKFAPGLTGLNGGMDPWNTPWDGANGVADPVTSTFYSNAGAYVTASEDKAKTFSTVYDTGGGTITAAYGIAATAHVVTDNKTFPNAKCPCLAFGVSADKGQTWKQMLVAEAGQFNTTGTVRYPVPAADPAHKGHFAIAVYAPDHKTVKVYYTADTGEGWKMAAPRAIPPDIPIAFVNMTSPGYTSDGRLMVVWRGFRGPGAFDTFLAMMTGDSFGPTIKVSPEISAYSPLSYTGNYGIGNGGGDFTTWVTGNNTTAFVAFPYSPGGRAEDTYLARVPLSILTK